MLVVVGFGGLVFGLGCWVLVFVGLGLGCCIRGLRFGVLDFEFRVLGLGVVGFGCLGRFLYFILKCGLRG